MGLAEKDFLEAGLAPRGTFQMDLPSSRTKRWVPRRKAQVVAAVRGGVLSLDEACDRYALTVEEFLSWQRAIDKFGLPGLRISHVQDHRGGR
ncbi:MAG TPA: DUF1153 domain-containing protein [Rhizomicrobium sp.]|nr:DUF1153 domain-containing protein [Rhizomicrobium sp.]